MNRRLRRAAGKGGKSAGPHRAAPDYAAEALFAIALEHHQTGRLPQAEQLYRDILSTNSRHPAALSHLGILSFQTGRNDAAIALFKKSAALEPDNPVSHFNLGLACAALRLDREAIAHNRKAISLRPDFVDAHINLAGLLLRNGDAATAITHFSRAIELKPDSRLAHENLATALLSERLPARSLRAAIHGLKIEATTELKTLFALALQQITSLGEIDLPECRSMLQRALRESWQRPGDLAESAFRLIAAHPDIAPAIERVAAARPRVLAPAELFDGDIPAALAGDEFVATYLRSGPVIGVVAELFFSALRRALLDRTGKNNDGSLELAAALAEQCFLNEYVFAATADEVTEARALADSIDLALAAGGQPAPYDLAVSACYAPLNRLANGALLIDQGPPPLRRVVTQQISEVREEQAIGAAIERLTPIDDETSLQVRAQYEANPYPRWTSTASTLKPEPIETYLLARFPAADPRALSGKPIRLLIAGCGTGRQTIDSIRMFQPAETLAIDLSIASLAYAIRKTRELALGNVRYGQADILKLAALNQSFDVIDASGVLHHLRDPLAGWRTLIELLRPGGAMRVALYSRGARSGVQLAKAKARELGLARDESGVRGFRQVAIDAADDDPLKEITKYQDFFSLSECRDLVFHVIDHEFDLPGIGQFLDQAGLVFLGFETTARPAYLKRFPRDPAAADLRNWHQFETENPATFAGMYQFWVQKPG